MNKDNLKKFFASVSEYSDKSVEEFAYHLLNTFEFSDLMELKKEASKITHEQAEKEAVSHINKNFKTNGVDLIERGKALAQLKETIKETGAVFDNSPSENEVSEESAKRAELEESSKRAELFDEMMLEFVSAKNQEMEKNIKQAEKEQEESSVLSFFENAYNDLNFAPKLEDLTVNDDVGVVKRVEE